MIEIERKFLVTSRDFIKESFAKYEITQGYLCSVPERTIRIRIKDDKAYLTIKGKSSETGLSRLEIEKEITKEEGTLLLKICEKGVIKKTRYNIKSGNHIIEVDVFYEENDGLLLAEIELKSENEFYEKPNWLGIEVTNDERYYNAYLNKIPFKNW